MDKNHAPQLARTKSRNRRISSTAVIALALCLLMLAIQVHGEPDARTAETIRHLIEQVSGSGLTFMRNDKTYTSGEAAAHMDKKYGHFRDSIETPEDFIERCASRSLMSGKPYLVINRDGMAQPTADWLRSELAAYKARSR